MMDEKKREIERENNELTISLHQRKKAFDVNLKIDNWL